MSSSSRGDGDKSIDVEELLEIETRCRELRKEKEMLKESQNQGFELIRGLELHVKSLSEAHLQDQNHIQKLERELKNCSQEIDYLQDQLSARNEEVKFLNDHVHDLEIKLTDMGDLREKIGRLIGELNRSNSDRLLLMQELENKEEELQQSALCIEKLEESVSSMALESQCEIERLKLDITAMEQMCLESRKLEEENVQEKSQMNVLIEEFEVQLQNAQEIIEELENENKVLRGKLTVSENNANIFCQKIKQWLRRKDRTQFDKDSIFGEPESMITISKDTRGCKELLGALLSEVALVLESDSNSKEQIKSMSHQINEYELLVKQLKELENKEEELQQSALCIEKLEESVSSMALESQCEIESLKLDITAMEQMCLESRKLEEENVQEKSQMNVLIEEFEVQLQNAQEIIEELENENKVLRGKLTVSENNANIFCQKIKQWLRRKDRTQFDKDSIFGEPESMITISKDTRGCKELLGALLSEVALVLESDSNSKEQIKSMSHQINEYELLVKQLKELENKEEELQQSALCIEKLEESVSPMALESQCEIESLKLDITAMEQMCLESRNLEEENVQEKSQMNVLIEEFEVQLQNAQEIIEELENENKVLRGKLTVSENNANIFCQKIKQWLRRKDRTQFDKDSIFGEPESMITISKDTRGCKELFGALLSEVTLVLESDSNSKEQIKSMSHQINEYELLVKQLKEELREQKLKAKEEAEDLAQEMAELRYQMTGMLEEECNRRASIEQVSLQRITELEAQIKKEPRNSMAVVRHLPES